MNQGYSEFQVADVYQSVNQQAAIQIDHIEFQVHYVTDVSLHNFPSFN